MKPMSQIRREIYAKVEAAMKPKWRRVGWRTVRRSNPDVIVRFGKNGCKVKMLNPKEDVLLTEEDKLRLVMEAQEFWNTQSK